MIKTGQFWNYLKKRGFTFFSGVPCSILENLLREGIRDPAITYVFAVRENAALGVASGAYLAGRHSGILLQNSGLGNIINALTSFNLLYKVPVLMFITWRGYKGKDAPEHLIMGEKTLPLLRELEIPYKVLTAEAWKKELTWAIRTMKNKSIPVAIIIKDGLL